MITSKPSCAEGLLMQGYWCRRSFLFVLRCAFRFIGGAVMRMKPVRAFACLLPRMRYPQSSGYGCALGRLLGTVGSWGDNNQCGANIVEQIECLSGTSGVSAWE